MGYAILHYDNSDTKLIGHVIHDIAGVVTGTYTSINQLSASATTNLCTIVNSAGRGNWEFLYPATHGTRASTTNVYVLRAPCQSSGSKYKYVRLRGCNSAAMALSTGNLFATSSSTGDGVILTACSAAASTTSVSDESPYNTFGSNVYDYRATSKELMYGPYFFISWSSRHLLIVSLDYSQTYYAFHGCFEHTETSISTYRNVAPFCHLTYYNDTYSAVTVPTNFGDSVSTPRSYFVMYNWYNPSTTQAQGIANLLASVNSQQADMTIVSSTSSSYPTTYTKNSSGSNAVYLQPLFWHQHHLGIPHQYISNLCDVYRVPAGIGNANDLLTVGGDTYVYFPVGSSGTYALAVKRA
jgi:hypothetical protein